MKQISQNIVKILLIFIIIQFAFIPVHKSQAAGFVDSIISTGDNFVNEGKAQEQLMNGVQVKIQISKVYNILLSIGVVLSVIIGAILGLKYLFGSIDEKADTKQLLIPYIIGCVVIFGAFGIWRLIITLLSGVVV